MSQPERLLILAPRGRDAQVISEQVALSGIESSIVGPDEIVEAIATGSLGAAIVADEAMDSFNLPALAQALADQPLWSDCQFLLLTRHDFGEWTRARITKLVGNVTILERPLSTDMLVSAVRSALRSRVRQRRTEAHLLAHAEAEAQVRELATSLEARVLARTDELTRALAEQADSEELYRLTVELSAQIPWSADDSGAVIAFGAKAVEHSGRPRVARLMTGWLSHIHPDDAGAVAAAWEHAVSSTSLYQQECRLLVDDGTYNWYCARAAPRLDGDGHVLRWYGTLEDIHERRTAADRLITMQAELVEISRTSAMGAMASTLAHELNQPLTAMTNFLRGSRRMLENKHPLEAVVEALDEADKSAIRAGEIVRRARELVTSGSVNRRSEPVKSLIAESQSLALEMSRWADIDLRLHFDPSVTVVSVDRVQIQQVLVNLIRNAAEAMADVGVRELVVSTRPRPNDMCEITVRDTGTGIAADVAARLFDPFNSTKSGGMGMGLSICRTIVEAHGGEIWSRPARKSGTVFGFTVPCG